MLSCFSFFISVKERLYLILSVIENSKRRELAAKRTGCSFLSPVDISGARTGNYETDRKK